MSSENGTCEYNLLHCLSNEVTKKENQSFKLPKLPDTFLHLFVTEEKNVVHHHVNINLAKMAASEVVRAHIISAQRLTSEDKAVKKTLKLSLKFEDKCIAFEPGDSFGFICPNPEKEVTMLLECLGLNEVSHKTCKISVKENKKLPNHIPHVSTLNDVFKSLVDIRVIPKKALLRIFASYAKTENERLVLEFLSSQEGAPFYENFIRKPSLSVLDVLLSFKSCIVPVERLLEHLPPMKPRYYSVVSSPLVSDNTFDIVFNVIEINNDGARNFTRKGVCTGWLENISEKLVKTTSNDVLDISQLSLEDSPMGILDYPAVHVYKRQNKFFRLPSTLETPLIMVGPGTGIAPFIGFLQHRRTEIEQMEKKSAVGETWLFYGCRHKEKDFLFRSEMEDFSSSGTLSRLSVCFSRDDQPVSQPRRVHESITVNAEQLVSLIESGAYVYVCGDTINMSKDVQNAFIQVFQCTKNCSREEAEQIVKKLQDDKRYLIDVWT